MLVSSNWSSSCSCRDRCAGDVEATPRNIKHHISYLCNNHLAGTRLEQAILHNATAFRDLAELKQLLKNRRRDENTNHGDASNLLSCHFAKLKGHQHAQPCFLKRKRCWPDSYRFIPKRAFHKRGSQAFILVKVIIIDLEGDIVAFGHQNRSTLRQPWT